MLADLVTGFMQTISPSVILYMLLGILIGTVIGFLPGLGGIFALSILLPFAYPLDMYAGIAFLLAAHAVINTSGSITSILFATPGSPGTAATIFDGYPLTQKGQAGRALGANLAASALGGVFGAIILFAAIPIIKPVVLLFESPEFFMLTLFGIAMISVVAEGSILKSLFIAVFGLLLSMIGLDPTYGAPRFTFGQLYLWEGLPLIPIVIGLFCIAEMLDLTSSGASAISEKAQKVNNMFQGVKDTFRHWVLVLRGGALGALLGAIPGIGSDTINFIAYGQAKQLSKTPEEFGKGAIEGVIGPESANNAKEGGILLPTLAFGIPGSASMAILLGAFMIWGVQPGPSMLTDNITLVYVMIFTLVIGNILGALFCVPLSIYAARLTNIRLSLLAPGVLALGVVAAFANSNHIADIVVAIIFGILGLVMKKLDFSRAVLLIGMVLGIIAEGYLNLTLRLYSYSFLSRPLVIVILIFILLTLFTPAIRKYMKKRKADRSSTI